MEFLLPHQEPSTFPGQVQLSHRVWESYDAIVDACCHAWSALMSTPKQIASITRRSWAQVKL
jgi:hypothetical protein